jgi:hypothetical protein
MKGAHLFERHRLATVEVAAVAFATEVNVFAAR